MARPLLQLSDIYLTFGGDPLLAGHLVPLAFDQAAVDALTKKVTDFTDAPVM